MIEFFESIRVSLIETYTTGPFVYVWFILGKAWWLIVPLFLLQAAWWYWVDYIQTHFLKTLDFRHLAVSVPKDVVGTPKSMEQVFASAFGLYHGLNMVEKFWKGQVQEPFSAELVGINGHVRFIFRVPRDWVDLFEANIYAHYPAAEIMEVEDYTQMIPDDFLERGWKAWGAELMFLKPDPYPIRTYPDFEERITQEVIDPMASITELMSRFSEGEQLWVQWVIRPVTSKEHDYLKEGNKLKDQLLGKLPPEQRSAILNALTAPLNMAGSMVDQAMGYEVGQPEPDKPQMPIMSPDLYNALLAIDRNMSKQSFEAKARVLYLAKKDTYLIQRGITGFMGHMNQFNTQNLNSFVPDGRTKTKIDYFMRNYREDLRKRNMLRMCKTRTFWAGNKPFILNTEELATIFHFPMPAVKAQRVERVPARKAGPPTDLPIAGLTKP